MPKPSDCHLTNRVGLSRTEVVWQLGWVNSVSGIRHVNALLVAGQTASHMLKDLPTPLGPDSSDGDAAAVPPGGPTTDDEDAAAPQVSH